MEAEWLSKEVAIWVFGKEDNKLPTSPFNPSMTSLPKEITKREHWKPGDPDSGTKFEKEQQ